MKANKVAESEVTALRELKDSITKYLNSVDAKGAAATTQPSLDRNVFRFEDLPAEIRNQIYGYALVAESPITFSRHDNTKTRESSWKARTKETKALYVLHATVRKTVLGKKGKEMIRVFKFADLNEASILRVSKTMRNETRPLLYACNTFAFKSGAAFREFYNGAKTAFHLLEKVHFYNAEYCNRATLPTAPLTYCKRLSEVVIKVQQIPPVHENNVFGVIIDLLECGCKSQVGPPDPNQDSQYCIRKVQGEQMRRLETVSLHSHTEQIHLCDNSAKDGLKDARTSKQVQAHLLRRRAIREIRKVGRFYLEE